MFDLLIQGGTVVDGTGAPAVAADVGVAGGRIRAVGRLAGAEAAQTVDARGLHVAPGFIDIHTHADIALLARPTHEPKVMQGCTTEVFSNCGLGFAPVTAEALELQREYLLGLFGDDAGVDWSWRTVGDFLARYRSGIGTNAAYLIPHGAVRVSVMGMADRPATPAQVEQMADLVREGMEAGARGLSTGVWYAPMSYAEEAEFVAICSVVAEHAGFFATHMRDYGDHLMEALEETFRVSALSGCPAQVSHLQVNGPENWGRSEEALRAIDAARARGLEITLDSYPYTAGSTMVQALLPGWATAGGPAAILARLRDLAQRERVEAAVRTSDNRDWSRVVLCGVQSAANKPYEGVDFREIAAARRLEVGQLICKLLEEENLQACFISHMGDERDVRAILSHPAQMIGSDGLHLTGSTHPRLYGTFPRVLARYCRDEGLIPLEEGVRKMTGLPAARLGLADRGRIAPGLAADLVVFDMSRIADTATFDDPCRYPEGIPFVFVNGVAVKEAGRATGALPGRVV